MIHPISSHINPNWNFNKLNNFHQRYAQPAFTGVQTSDGDSSDITTFDSSFKSTYQGLINKYSKMKNAVTGFFKKRQLRKIEHDEGIALRVFQQSQEEFLKGQDELIQLHKAKLELLKKNNASLDEIIDLKTALEQQEKIKQKMQDIANCKSQKQGFDSIGGYELEKKILIEDFIEKIPQEQAGLDVDLPNCILFFGPNGNGKTSFAKAFANSSGCKFPKSIKGSGATKEARQQSFLERLTEAMIDAENSFANDRTRTILLVDEFDEYANKDSVILPELTSILEHCSESFHCTLFATTNNPLDIAEELRNDKRIPVKVYISPPDFENTVSVFGHYLKDYSHEPLNYDELAEEIQKVQPKAAYNNSQIEEICNNAYENAIGKITQEDLIYQIQITEPGITEEDLIKFENEKLKINVRNSKNDDGNNN